MTVNARSRSHFQSLPVFSAGLAVVHSVCSLDAYPAHRLLNRLYITLSLSKRDARKIPLRPTLVSLSVHHRSEAALIQSFERRNDLARTCSDWLMNRRFSVSGCSWSSGLRSWG